MANINENESAGANILTDEIKMYINSQIDKKFENERQKDKETIVSEFKKQVMSKNILDNYNDNYSEINIIPEPIDNFNNIKTTYEINNTCVEKCINNNSELELTNLDQSINENISNKIYNNDYSEITIIPESIDIFSNTKTTYDIDNTYVGKCVNNNNEIELTNLDQSVNNIVSNDVNHLSNSDDTDKSDFYKILCKRNGIILSPESIEICDNFLVVDNILNNIGFNNISPYSFRNNGKINIQERIDVIFEEPKIPIKFNDINNMTITVCTIIGEFRTSYMKRVLEGEPTFYLNQTYRLDSFIKKCNHDGNKINAYRIIKEQCIVIFINGINEIIYSDYVGANYKGYIIVFKSSKNSICFFDV